MSLAQNLLDAGMTSILASNGESLTFRSGTVIGLVTRDPAWGLNFTPGAPPGDQSVIELKVSALTSAPLLGERFLDEFDYQHRVARVKRVTNWYRIECISSPAPQSAVLTDSGGVWVTDNDNPVLPG